MIYVGHEDIAGKRAVRRGLRVDIKTDPGPNFDWIRFRRDLHALRTV
jgi:N-acetyl-anhydromuramyl-L-alanine amidase AmpD